MEELQNLLRVLGTSQVCHRINLINGNSVICILLEPVNWLESYLLKKKEDETRHSVNCHPIRQTNKITQNSWQKYYFPKFLREMAIVLSYEGKSLKYNYSHFH